MNASPTSRRWSSSFFGLGYFAAVSGAISAGNGSYLGWLGMFVVVTGASLAVFFLLLVLAARWAVKDRGFWQFGLNSLFLLLGAVAVYLSALRFVLQFHNLQLEKLTAAAWWGVLAGNVMFCLLSSVPLMMLGEGVLWGAVWILKKVRIRSTNR